MEKRRFRFNIIDLLIILVVVAVGLVAYLVFFKADPPAPVDEMEKAKIRYVLQVSQLSADFADNIEVGESVYDKDAGGVAGEIVAVDPKPYYYIGHDKVDGGQVRTLDEDYVNLYITVEADATVVDELYELVPAAYRVIFTRERITAIVQTIFDCVKSYAKKQK